MNEQSLVEQFADAKGSSYQRYLHMFVGQESLAALLRYEILTGLLGPMPGALGYFLRGKCYPRLLQQMGRGTIIGRSVVLRSPARICLGENVLIDDQAVLDAKGLASAVELGNQILLGRNSILSCNDAQIRIGNFVSIGPFCYFASRSHITIGSNVSIGSGTHLTAGGHAFDDPDTPIIRQKRVSEGIVVEDDVWIGTGSRVLDGVTIGRNSIIGAGAVVTADIPAQTVAVGIPARVIRQRHEQLR
jgi:acetyltransferase-like isoleucine patch superfamily enzyme